MQADVAQARQAAEEEAERLQLENNNLKQTAAITTAEVADLRLKADEANTVIADMKLTAHEAATQIAEMRGAAQQASTAHAKLQADLASAKTSAALWKEKATFTTAASSGPVDNLWRDKCAELERALRKKAVACDRAEQSAARRLQRLEDAHADKKELMEYCRVSLRSTHSHVL